MWGGQRGTRYLFYSPTVGALQARDWRGVGNQYVFDDQKLVIEVQDTTGTLSPGAHEESYNGQDAYNDMLVAENGLLHRERTGRSTIHEQKDRSIELYARSTSDYEGGAEHE